LRTSELSTLRTSTGEVHALVAVVVELPDGLVLGQGAHARQALVGQVEAEPEREGDAEELPGRDEAAHEPVHRVDLVVLAVHVEVAVGAEVAERHLERAREREAGGVVVVGAEVLHVGRGGAPHRGAAGAEPEGVERVGGRGPRDAQPREQENGQGEPTSAARPGHQNLTPTSIPATSTWPPTLAWLDVPGSPTGPDVNVSVRGWSR
jgi:hypothetical protein